MLAADGPIAFMLEDIMDELGSLPFLRVNFERGIREILMATLMNEDQPMASIHIYTDRNRFTDEFKSIIRYSAAVVELR